MHLEAYVMSALAYTLELTEYATACKDVGLVSHLHTLTHAASLAYILLSVIRATAVCVYTAACLVQ